MIRPVKILVLAAMALTSQLYSPNADSIVVENLYQATIPVANQSADERARAASVGLLEVLYRLTGQQTIETETEGVIKSALDKADRYLQQFSYGQLESQGGIEFEKPVKVINLKFAANSVRRLIQSAQLPLWGANRPGVLLWLGVENPDTLKHQILNGSVEHPAFPAFEHGAKLRGLPPLYPVLDLEDEINISAEDLWNLDEDKIIQASSRYSADSILAGRIYKTAKGAWFGQWKFFFQGRTVAFTGYAENINQYMLEAVNRIGPVLAASYAISNKVADANLIEIELTGISDAKAYAQSAAYLNKLSSVKSAQAIQVMTDRVIFSVALRGEFNQFIQAVSLDPKIRRLNSGQNVQANSVLESQVKGSSAIRYFFSWQP